MATYSTFKYGTGVQYGRAGRDAAVTAVVGVHAGWPAGRRACPELWTADPDTLAPVAALAHWQDGQRQAQLADDFLHEETLTFAVADVPAGRYYPDGPDAAALAPGALVRPKWVVTTASGSLTTWGLPYRVRPAPVGPRDALGPDLVPVEAEDWCRAGFNTSLPFASLTPLRQLVALKDALVLAGMPDPLGDTYAGLVHALCWHVSGGRVVVDAAWPSPTYPTGDALAAIQDAPTEPFGTGSTARGALAWLWPSAPFRVYYRADGWLALRGGQARRDSGWVLSCAASTDGGPFAVPFERLTPALAQPEYTGVRWEYVYEVGDGGSGTVIRRVVLADRASSHPRLPHSGPYARTHTIIDRGGVGVTVAQQAAATLLARALGAADTVTVDLDSAIPAPPLGDEVRIADPPRVDGWYALQQLTQPFGPGAQSWQLGWRA